MAAAVASAREYNGPGVQSLSPEPRPVVVTFPVNGDLETIVLTCNKDGMDFLRRGQYKQAFEQLKYAEAVLDARGGGGEDEPTNLLAVTCNNLGCYYKKVGKLHAALSYLRKALKIEVQLQTDDATVAGTHLNICAILSKLDKHDKAVQHALCALELISTRVASAPETVTQEEHSVLAIAYHNVAVERDFMHQWDQAATAYQQGYQVAKKYLGEQHPLTQTLGKNCDAAVQKSQKFARDRPPPPPAQQRSSTSQEVPPRRGGRPPPADGPSYGASPSAAERAAARRSGSPSLAGPQASASLLPDIGPLSARSNRREREQSEEAGSWRTAAVPSQLPPIGGGFPSAGGTVEQYQASVGSTYLAPHSHGMEPYGAEGAWPQHQPSYLNRIAQEVPSAVPFAAAPPSPPPLVLAPGAAGSSSRPPRAKLRLEASAPPPPPRADAPQPPCGPNGGRPRPRSLTARAQRELARANGGPHGSLAADQAATGGLPGGLRPQQSQLLRRSAAEKIQRAWRRSHRRRTTTFGKQKQHNAAATRIQALYRGFRVQRRRRVRAITIIQKWARGFLVRVAKWRRKSAISIQRQARGMAIRRAYERKRQAAVALQKVARGVLARDRVKVFKAKALWAAVMLQRAARRWKAYQIMRARRRVKDNKEARVRGATRIQSRFRGIQGRQRFAEIKRAWEVARRRRLAATKIQATARRRIAMHKVDAIRRLRLQGQHKAATTIRKFWLRFVLCRRYRQLRKEFRMHEKSIVTMQRYARGFIVRLRMWRGAIRAEEELWAAVEIQRCWRGFQGRTRWAREFQRVHRRTAAAELLQRHIRGWLARTRAHRIRKRRARAEFEKARRRFKAAQKLQALVRGVQCRKRMRSFRERKVEAATRIQRVHRGHMLRCRLWEKEVNRSTVRIQAAMRGFLVRNRRFHVLLKVIVVQSNWRRWHRWIPEAERTRRLEAWQLRRAQERAAR